VINVPGASGIVGWKELLNRPADGYTILLSSGTPVLALMFEDKPAVDIEKDIKIACYIGQYRAVLLVQPDKSWSTWEGYVDYAKKHPGEVTLGGTMTQLMGGARVLSQLNLDINYVSYDSTGDAITDLLGGHIMSACGTESTADTVVPEKAVALLNTSNSAIPLKKFKDLRKAPDVGAKGIIFPRYVALHPKTPDEIVDIVSEKMGDIAKDKSFQRLMKKLGEQIEYLPRAEAQKEYQDLIDSARQAMKYLK
jgi:tripartite-type tricarboxylate transporter receptor subunit TctC